MGNLPFDADDALLKQTFGGCGRVLFVRFAVDEAERARGFCHVVFEDKDGKVRVRLYPHPDPNPDPSPSPSPKPKPKPNPKPNPYLNPNPDQAASDGQVEYGEP